MCVRNPVIVTAITAVQFTSILPENEAHIGPNREKKEHVLPIVSFKRLSVVISACCVNVPNDAEKGLLTGTCIKASFPRTNFTVRLHTPFPFTSFILCFIPQLHTEAVPFEPWSPCRLSDALHQSQASLHRPPRKGKSHEMYILAPS